MSTGFPTNGRIGTSPKETEKERPEGRSWASERVEKGVIRPKVCEAEMGENEPITRPNHAIGGQARLSVRRALSDTESFDDGTWWRKLHPSTNTHFLWTRFGFRG